MPEPSYAFNYNDDAVVVRLSVLETNMNMVQAILNKIDEEEKEHRREHTEQTEKINTQMQALKLELKDDLSTVKTDLTKDINEINKQISEQNIVLNKISEKLDSLDKWRWMVVGFAAAIGFVLAEFGKISKIFN